jgi:ubiquinol-cytochrome c reductase iron-sulfur subunit
MGKSEKMAKDNSAMPHVEAGEAPCVNSGRRKLLLGLTGLFGGVSVISALTPFLSAWKPSARAQAAGAPVEVDLTGLNEGEVRIVEWRGKPVWILPRTEEDVERLTQLNEKLRDPLSKVKQQPEYVDPVTRSRKPEYLILVGVCTHLGCSPVFKPFEPQNSEAWPGGFFCPCHGSTFDMAGRVFKGVPAPINLEVPPHIYLSENKVLIGTDSEENIA